MKQLEKLFMPGEYIWIGNEYSKDPSGPFFCINPLKSSKRTNDNVAEYRNFLMEFDSGTYEEQLSALDMLKKANFAPTTVVFSGSKSLHLVYSMAEKLELDYKQAWKSIAMNIISITKLIPDPSCKNPARLSRLGGALRTVAEKKVEQTLVDCEGPLIKNETITNLSEKYKVKITGNSIEKKDIVHDMSKEAFLEKLKQNRGLYGVLKSVNFWAAPVNMYPEIRRLSLWAIDSTGVPKETLLSYYKEDIFPALLEVGYPREKLEIPVHSAYGYRD